MTIAVTVDISHAFVEFVHDDPAERSRDAARIAVIGGSCLIRELEQAFVTVGPMTTKVSRFDPIIVLTIDSPETVCGSQALTSALMISRSRYEGAGVAVWTARSPAAYWHAAVSAATSKRPMNERDGRAMPV